MRYSRQIDIVEQERLREARVMIAGVGGLGGFSALYLAMAGIGELVLVDYDSVEESNLNRQILYTTEDLGRKKVEVARERIEKINPEVSVEIVEERIEEGFKMPKVDIVVDGLDNYETRKILERKSRGMDVPYVFGAVEGYMGMVSFIDSSTTGLDAILKNAPHSVPQVLGATAGVTAGIQSMEVIKFLSGRGDLLRNRLLIYDGLSTNFLEVKL